MYANGVALALLKQGSHVRSTSERNLRDLEAAVAQSGAARVEPCKHDDHQTERETERDRERDRERQRERQRETERDRERQRERQRETQREKENVGCLLTKRERERERRKRFGRFIVSLPLSGFVQTLFVDSSEHVSVT